MDDYLKNVIVFDDMILETVSLKVTVISLVFSTSMIVFLLTLNFTLLASDSLAYASSTLSNSTDLTKTNTNVALSSSLLGNTEAKKIRVGDIEMGYKVLENGPPLLLIMGSGGTMEVGRGCTC